MAIVASGVLFTLVGVTLPSSWRVERSIIIDAPIDTVRPWVSNLRRWQEWCAWNKDRDPTVRNTYSGPAEGSGAEWAWQGPTMGRGRVVITHDSDTLLELEETIESSAPNAHAVISFTALDGKTRVGWLDEGTLPVMVGGFFRASVEQRLGQDVETSLATLKRLVEHQDDASPLDGGR